MVNFDLFGSLYIGIFKFLGYYGLMGFYGNSLWYFKMILFCGLMIMVVL